MELDAPKIKWRWWSLPMAGLEPLVGGPFASAFSSLTALRMTTKVRYVLFAEAKVRYERRAIDAEVRLGVLALTGI